MLKLVVEEGGKRRAFKLGDGILTVGSGAGAKLRLSSVDVAEIHVELVVQQGAMVVRTRPGVMPPTINGTLAAGETPVPAGAVVELGGARLWLEGAGQAAPQPAARSEPRRAAPARQTARSKADQAQDQAIRRQRAIEQSKRAEPRSKVQRSRPRVERGAPGWLIAGAILLVAVLGFLFVKSGFDKSVEDGAGTVFGSIAAAQQMLEVGNLDTAIEKLDGIPSDAELTPAQKGAVDKIRAEVKKRREFQDVDSRNIVGTKWFDVYLAGYEKSQLQMSPPDHKVKLFLKRCQEFRRRWPSHPELEWVGRQERRFKGAVDMSLPPTYDDVHWEVKHLATGKPRDYRTAFELIDKYLARADADRKGELEELRAQYVGEREAHQVDRLQQAKHEVRKNKDYVQSIKELVNLIAYQGDTAFENEAAEILLGMEKVPQVDLKGTLLTYKQRQPEKFALLFKNSMMKSYADRVGLD